VYMPSLRTAIEARPWRPLPRGGSKSRASPDLTAWAMTPARADYVTIPIAAAITGGSVIAIRRKI